VNEEDALLAAIVAHPDEDTPRLAFADWLDEHGDADRAAFIRLQIREPHIEDEAERYRVGHEIRRLIEKNYDRLRADLPKGLNPDYHDFERGFLTTLDTTVAKVTRVSKRAWARHPIQKLNLNEASGRLDRVLALPQLNRIRELSVVTDWGKPDLLPSDLEALATCPNLTGVRELMFRTKVGNPLAAALARCPSLRNLDDLALHECTIDADGLAVLTETGAANLRRLKKLFLQSCLMSAEAAGVLARAPALAALETLYVWQQDGPKDAVFGDEGLAALAQSPHLGNLRCLWLYMQKIGHAGARALSATRHLTNLRKLSLGFCRIGAEGACALANGPWPELALQLDHCDLGDDAAEALAEAPALVALDLSSNRIGDAGAKALSRAPGLKGLVALDVGENSIGDEGARALGESTALPKLQRLRVRSAYGVGPSLAVVDALKARFEEGIGFNTFR
jgi:uncharacterized protein (TIGR02996 family)